MRKTTLTFALLSVVASLAAPRVARAWDEDTCSPGSEPESTAEFPDPACADPQPLLGSNPSIQYDHATAHWEMTYAMARCVGIDDNEGQRIAAADEGTDMSSPACGSKIINNNTDGQYYLAGYACGYEVGTGDVSQSAVPAYAETLRWMHTDRCRFVTSNGNLHGHGEFFHYPYWSTGGSSNSLNSLERWVFNEAQTLVDPADTAQSANGCDMAGTTTVDPSTPACNTITVSNLNDYVTSQPVCPGVAQSEWRMPARPSSMDGDRAFRMGIYMHSLGDSYSHYTCQYYSGQPETSAHTVQVPIDSTATDHNDYNTTRGKRCGTSESDPGERRSGVSFEMCENACSLDAHSLEWGTSDTANYGNATATTALRDRSVAGLRAVWSSLVRYRGWSSRDAAQVTTMRDSITSTFNGYYNGDDRQAYARRLATSNRPQSCGCPGGVFGLARGSNGLYYCRTLQSIFVTTTNSATATPVTVVPIARMAGITAVQLYAWGVFQKSDGTTETVPISTSANWTESSAFFSVDNSASSATIGLVTSSTPSTGAGDLVLTKLGVSTTVRVMNVGN